MKTKVYIAGKLNDMAVDYIKNVHKMIGWAYKVRQLGFAVYVPCNDFLEGLVNGTFGYGEYFSNSQPWLAASDCVFVCPGYESSSGTLREIELATSLNIPVYYTLDSLVRNSSASIRD